MKFKNFLLYFFAFFALFIQFQNKCFAQKDLYKFYDKDKYEISLVLLDVIKKEKHNIYKSDVENGFFYIQPKLTFNGQTNNDFIIFNLKQVDKDVYMFVENNFNSLPKKDKIISYCKKNGFASIKIKNKELMDKFQINSQNIINGQYSSDEIVYKIDKENTVDKEIISYIKNQESVTNNKEIDKSEEKNSTHKSSNIQLENKEVNNVPTSNKKNQEKIVNNKQIIEIEEKHVIKNSIIKKIIDFGFDCALFGIFL